MKVAGGLLRDMTIHDFDLARFLLGEEPVEVAAFANALIAQEVRDLGENDTAMILLRTAAGRQCCITNYRKATYGYDQRIEAVGELGMLKAENRRATTRRALGRPAAPRPRTRSSTSSSSATARPMSASSTTSSTRWRRAARAIPASRPAGGRCCWPTRPTS